MESRLLVDCDGVLADTMGYALKIVNHEENVNIIHADIRDYWFDELPVKKDVFVDVLRTKGFYRELGVITGAVEAVNRLREQYDVVVCTAPMPGAEGCEGEKREWLAQHFDSDFAEQAIVIPDKSKVQGKAIIEDNPFIQGDFKVVMFDQPWNRFGLFKYRMFGWGDLKPIKRAMES